MRPSLPILLAALALAAPAFAQPADEPESPIAWISVVAEPNRPTRLSVNGRTTGPAIASALERISGQPPQTSDYGNGWAQWGCSLPPPTRQGLVLEQELRLAPLLAALREAGQPSVMVMVETGTGPIRLRGATVLARSKGILNTSVSTSYAGSLIMESGWRRADVARVIGALALALLLPLLAGLMVWRRSLSVDRAPERWLTRAIAFQSIMISGWAAWLAALEGTRVDDLTRFALGGGALPMIAPLWMLGFLPATLALAAMARANTRRLRGFDPRPRGIAGVLTSARALVALALLMVGITGLAAADYRLGVFALLGAIAAATLLPGARGPLGTRPQALSAGALRDRLFDLADRAGVKLRELYVAPMRRQRMANAFAINGGVVMLTDELLDRISKREVDAVLAHEVSHLEHHHPVRMVLSAMVVWMLFWGLGGPLQLPYAFPIGLAAAWLAFLFVARRCEFAADAGAAALTGDPEAMISGLGRLAKLNDSPLAWGRGIGLLITHPTTEARARAIGRRAGLAPARVLELMTNGIDSDERYGVAERPGEEERVFSTAWKAGVTGRLSLALLATAVVTPALGLATARAIGVEVPHAVAIVAGAALALFAMLLGQDLLAARGMTGLEEAIRKRVGMGKLGTFVALSPGDRSRIYEGFHDWDLGVFEIAADRLIYRGEQITLELPRAAVRAIEVGARTPSWIPAPRVVVRWAVPGGDEAVSLRPAGCRRVSAIAGASRMLAAKLHDWLGASGATSRATSSSPSSTGPAGVGPVTARTPAEASAPRDLPALMVLLGILAAAAAFIAGFDLWRGLDLFASALLAAMAMRWPAMTSREPKSASAPSAPADRRAA